MKLQVVVRFAVVGFIMRFDKTSDGFKMMVPCDLCEGDFQFGPNRSAGRKVVSWDAMVCETSDRMNWDGIDPHRHAALIQRLKQSGVQLQLLPGGFVKIPAQGH